MGSKVIGFIAALAVIVVVGVQLSMALGLFGPSADSVAKPGTAELAAAPAQATVEAPAKAQPAVLVGLQSPSVDPSSSPSGSTSASASNIVLSAVIVTSGGRFALVRDPEDGSVHRVRQGEKVAKWTVEEIRDASVLVSAQGAVEEVWLRAFRSAPLASSGQQHEEDSGLAPVVFSERNGPQATIPRPRRPARGPRQSAGGVREASAQP